jgi:hypothetical protein
VSLDLSALCFYDSRTGRQAGRRTYIIEKIEKINNSSQSNKLIITLINDYEFTACSKPSAKPNRLYSVLRKYRSLSSSNGWGGLNPNVENQINQSRDRPVVYMTISKRNPNDSTRTMRQDAAKFKTNKLTTKVQGVPEIYAPSHTPSRNSCRHVSNLSLSRHLSGPAIQARRESLSIQKWDFVHARAPFMSSTLILLAIL